ncbi:hypothetical protein [Ornithinimicrobium murale]|uniref:hypothetical protein n=1 Tax=Ornithinimicrobium murale TaxID=1050153 RepID=UPI000E0D82C4|nr:hypothetical protein [Ornithinimicrobium murale]
MSTQLVEPALVDVLGTFPENTVVLDGSGRRWSREQWCAATGSEGSLVCSLRWVGPALTVLTTDELAYRGPLTALSVPGEDIPARHLLGECI